MEPNWIIDLLESALQIWTEKLSEIWSLLTQTPQSFRVSLLKELYASLSAEEKAILTDACKICVIRSCPVYLVEGDHTNMKITTQGDYEIAQAIVAGRKHG